MPIEITELFDKALIAVPFVLYFIGTRIKAGGVDNKWIPTINTVIGILLVALYYVAMGKMVNNLPLLFYTSIIQGVLAGAMSVYAHQQIKQLSPEER